MGYQGKQNGVSESGALSTWGEKASFGRGVHSKPAAGRLRRRRRASLLAGQLVHQHAQRQLAGEPKPECSARWFESLPAAPSITNANVLRLGAIYPRFDGRRVASGASTPSHHRPSLNGRLRNGRLWRIVLQKSKVATPRIFGENSKHEPMDHSCNLSPVSEVACEFSARRLGPTDLYPKTAPPP